jgi:redox-sensitive bicupin YhaK (pirin superfamily)
VVSGSVTVSTEGQDRIVAVNEAVGAQGLDDGGVLWIMPHGDAQILLLAGHDAKEPVAVHGPFIMNNKQELTAAFDRYRDGSMGHLA